MFKSRFLTILLVKIDLEENQFIQRVTMNILSKLQYIQNKHFYRKNEENNIKNRILFCVPLHDILLK
jgi:hypothetical protein